MDNATVVYTGIEGALLIRPKVWNDERGGFFEVFRASWFTDKHQWSQWNVSRSKGNVVRGLHFHKLQTDFWFVTHGTLMAALIDLRLDSPTYLQSRLIPLEALDPAGLYIPPGVLHGYRVTNEATMMYLVDVEYTGKDEYGVAWNDKALGLPMNWYRDPAPTLSPRDAAAQPLAALGLPGR